MIGTIFATPVSAVFVTRKGVDASLAGLAMSFTLQYTTAFEWTIRQYSSTQLSMNFTEKALEYSRMVTEYQGEADAPAAWPTEGCSEFENLVVGYAPDEVMFKWISFRISESQRIGVVGRTGSWKSQFDTYPIPIPRCPKGQSPCIWC